MSNRFEEIEEQLKQLETIPLVSAGARPRTKEIESFSAAERSELAPAKIQNVKDKGHYPGQPEKVHQGVAVRQSPEAASGRLARAASRVIDFCRWRWKARLKALEDQVLAESQERMREAVGDVIEDARRQLEVLTNELIPTYRMRLDKSIANSAATFIPQSALSLERQDGTCGYTGPPNNPTALSEDTAQPWRPQGTTAESSNTRHAANSDSLQEQLAHAFSPVVEEIQSNSAAFLEHLNLQLNSTLRAFGEKATRHAAEEFGKIAVEVLQVKTSRSHSPLRQVTQQDDGLGLPVGNSRLVVKDRGVKKEVRSGLQCSSSEVPASLHTNSGPGGAERHQAAAKGRSAGKVATGAPNWRILGLS